MQDNYNRWIESGLRELEGLANQEGWWPMLLRAKYCHVEGIKNQEQWEALQKEQGR